MRSDATLRVEISDNLAGYKRVIYLNVKMLR